jgi:hypothetical protein
MAYFLYGNENTHPYKLSKTFKIIPIKGSPFTIQKLQELF